MLIGEDDISDLSHVFAITMRIRTCFHFVLIGRNLTARSMGNNRGIGGTIQTSET